MATDERTPQQMRREKLDADRAAAAEQAAKGRGFKAGHYKAKTRVSHDGVDYMPGEDVQDLTAVQVEQLASVDAIEMPDPPGDKAAKAVAAADQAAQDAEDARKAAEAERTNASIKAGQEQAAAAQKAEAKR